MKVLAVLALGFGALSGSQVAPLSFVDFVPTAAGTTNVGQSLQTVKLGLNYTLGEDLHAQRQPSASDHRLREVAKAKIPA